MSERTIASRPSMDQTVAIVDFMEKHPSLALGQMRGLEGRDESKRLWYQLSRIVNNLNGPTRPTKSWIKFWADKKSTVRSKVQSSGGDSNNLHSNIEKRIWDLFLANDKPNKTRKVLKPQQPELQYLGTEFLDESSMDEHVKPEPALAFEVETPVMDAEDRQNLIIEKMIKAMTDQATAMGQLAQASQASTQAMERIADASHMQARALDRLASTFESIGSATHELRNAIVGIDNNMKRFYTAPS